MGNSKSSHSRSQSTKVQRRENKRRGVDRPRSAPPVDTGADGVSFDQRFGGSAADLTGRPSFKVNPLPSDFDSSKGPGGNFTHDHRERDAYQRTLEEVLAIWPEYHPLRDVQAETVRSEGLFTIRQVFQRLCEQHSLIGSLSRDKHESNQLIQDLQADNRGLIAHLKGQDEEIAALRENALYLKNELQNRGVNVNLPERQPSNRGGYDKLGGRTYPDGSEAPGDPKPSYVDRLRQRAADGLVMATPIVQMEGQKGAVALQRKTSMRATAAEQSGDPNKRVDELNEKIKRLQSALERERRQNQISSDRERSDTLPRQKGVTADVIVTKYKQLASDAIDKVFLVVSQHLGHVNETRRITFICSIMVLAFKQADSCLRRFHTRIQASIREPLKLDPSPTETEASEKPGESKGRVLRHVSKIEESGSKLFQRTWASGDIPQDLLDQMAIFLGMTADNTDVGPLVEDVVDGLRQDYADCITPALLNHHTFTKFVHTCCRLAWQMNVIIPPMEISADTWRQFDERIHMNSTYTEKESLDMEELDHFVWPILYSRKGGDVLCKGSVNVKLSKKL